MSQPIINAVVVCGSIYRIAKECWTPAGINAAEALSTTDFSPGLEIALVHLRVHLTTAFDEVKRRYSCVSNSLATDEQDIKNSW